MPTTAAEGSATALLLVSAVALVDADGRVLLARRPEGKPLAGLWEFPGGKIAPGETPEAALIRELREELGSRRRKAALRRSPLPPTATTTAISSCRSSFAGSGKAARSPARAKNWPG